MSDERKVTGIFSSIILIFLVIIVVISEANEKDKKEKYLNLRSKCEAKGMSIVHTKYEYVCVTGSFIDDDRGGK